MTHTRAFSGKWLVIGLLGFGVFCTGGMWVYWKLHLGPFFPLQRALADEFPKSSPRVDGGRHKNSPMTLRVALTVNFPPTEDDPRVPPIFERILELARQHVDLSRYEIVEEYLVFRQPERATPIRLKREVNLRAE